MKELQDVRESGKWVGGDAMMIELTIFIEHGALRMSRKPISLGL